MNIMKLAAALVFASIAFVLDAAPAAKGEVVAEGYPSWNGVSDKNYLRGRMISVSDLRHRALIVIELDPADPKLIEQLPMFSRLASFDPLASSHGIIWENYVLPRDMLILISFRGKRNEPMLVQHTAAKIAELRGISVEELIEATYQNGKRIYGIE